MMARSKDNGISIASKDMACSCALLVYDKCWNNPNNNSRKHRNRNHNRNQNPQAQAQVAPQESEDRDHRVYMLVPMV